MRMLKLLFLLFSVCVFALSAAKLRSALDDSANTEQSQAQAQSEQTGAPYTLRREGEKLLTSGGRVLGAVAVGKTLPEAIDAAYAVADRIIFEGKFCRRDIGQKALKA